MAKREIKPIYWKDGCLFVLDQRQLPDRQVYLRCRDMRSVAAAIKDMALRGAPLIGGAAAYGFVLAAKALKGKDARRWAEQIEAAAKHLRAARPTAVNLMYSVDRMSQVTRNWFFQHAGESRHPDSSGSEPRLAPGRRETLINLLKEEADRIFKEDADANRRMADFGANLLPANSNVITICNTGALATCGIGTAFGVIRRAHELGKIRHVYACETRPYLQGSRLTMWELMQNGIPASLITDNMAAHIMATEKISAVLAGADRIAANADAANKIGTYGLSILAKHHGVPFYIVAPTSTVDLKTADGRGIPIEERSHEEVIRLGATRIAPKGARARHPAFDVTPHALITAIVTERGIAKPANAEELRKVAA